MGAPAFYQLGALIATLAYPQAYKQVQIPTWVDHMGLNGVLRRDFYDLHPRYVFNITWEFLTASELNDVKNVWSYLSTAESIAYTDMEGTTYTAEADDQSFKLDWIGRTEGVNGVLQTVYSCHLIFIGVSSSTLSIP